MRNINNNLPQYPVSPNSGGGLAPHNQYMLINMEKCIPNSLGQHQTVPVAGVFATLDGRTPNNNDIGTRIVYQHDPLESVHIITGVQPINPQVGSVTTPWVTTTNPCGGGGTPPRYLTLEFCQEGMGGCPYGAYGGCFRVDGREPLASDIGKSVLYTGNFSQGNNPPPTAPPNGCVMKITGITGLCDSLGAIVENVNIINPTPNPCNVTSPPRPMARKGRGLRDNRIGRGLSDNRMSRYKGLKG